MNRTLILAIVGIVVVVGGLYFYTKATDTKEVEEVALSPENATYTIDGESFTLVEGKVEKEIAPDSATQNMVSLFGEPAYGDIDRDGDDDAVVILVNDAGGSGTFYYAAIAANIDGEYKGTDTILLGDRIAPQTFYIEGNRAIVNYVVRAPGEPFTAQPSIGESLHLQFDPESLMLITVEVDFEGEADPSVMKLDMHTWTWVSTTYESEEELTPKNPQAFTITFKEDGTFSATTDCNSMGGTYEVDDQGITFGENIAMTKMYCEGSQEQEFAALFGEIESYTFTSRGQLIFTLDSGGSAVFR